MAQLRTLAIISAVRWHGENGAIVRALTPANGLVGGYVRGARSRTHRPILIPGNVVQAEFRARTDAQLASLTVELTQSRGPQLAEPLASAAIGWATALTADLLPEEHDYPPLYPALSGVLDAIGAAPSARGWAVAIIRYELLLLQVLGFGLALDECAATGATEDLCYVSPKSGAAVSAAAGASWKEKLLPLPAFLTEAGEAEWDAIFDGFRLTGHFLHRHFFDGRPRDPMPARDILIERLRRVMG